MSMNDEKFVHAVNLANANAAELKIQTQPPTTTSNASAAVAVLDSGPCFNQLPSHLINHMFSFADVSSLAAVFAFFAFVLSSKPLVDAVGGFLSSFVATCTKRCAVAGGWRGESAGQTFRRSQGSSICACLLIFCDFVCFPQAVLFFLESVARHKAEAEARLAV